MHTSRTTTVASDGAGLRLDRWIRARHRTLAYGRVQKLLRTGRVRIDGRRAEECLRLQPGQSIVSPPRFEDDRTRFLRATTLYEDGAVIVLNKSPGLAVQGSGRPGGQSPLVFSQYGIPGMVPIRDRCQA